MQIIQWQKGRKICSTIPMEPDKAERMAESICRDGFRVIKIYECQKVGRD